jgi:hypothetical protein
MESPNYQNKDANTHILDKLRDLQSVIPTSFEGTQAPEKFSFFDAPITNTKSKETMTLLEAVDLIKSDYYKKYCEKIRELGDKKHRDSAKKHLDYVTFGGIFEHRSKETLKEASGLMAIDIDDLPVDQVPIAKSITNSNPYTAACFVSPSGLGLKIIVKIPKDSEKYKDLFLSFNNSIGITNADTSTNDISRACYLSYDPEIYYNPESLTWDFGVSDVIGGESAIKVPFQTSIPSSTSNIKRIKIDYSRSGVAWRDMCILIESGLQKTEVFSQMELKSEYWKNETPRWKELTYNNYFKLHPNFKIKIKIELPAGFESKKSRTIGDVADEIGSAISEINQIFWKPATKSVIEINNDGFSELIPDKFVTRIEKYVYLYRSVYDRNKKIWDNIEKNLNTNDAKKIILSSQFTEKLPIIKRFFTVPMPVINNKGILILPKRGYNKEIEAWLDENSPEIKDMTLKDAKLLLETIYCDFCFTKEQDKINAIAALITPFCRVLYPRFTCRTPVFHYKANRPGAGKDFCAGITGIVYTGYAIEETPLSSGKLVYDDEFRKKIMCKFVSGTSRVHISNNTGNLDSPTLQSLATNEMYSDRELGKSKDFTFENNLELSFSGNIGLTMPADMIRRTIPINQGFFQEDINTRIFKDPNLWGTVKNKRSEILSAIYSFIKNWDNLGRPNGPTHFVSFPEWGNVVGGIMTAAKIGDPCIINDDLFGVASDTDTDDAKNLFYACYKKWPSQGVTTSEIANAIKLDLPGFENLFTDLDLNKRGDQTRFGNKIASFKDRIFGNIKMSSDDNVSYRRKHTFNTISEDLSCWIKPTGNLNDNDNLKK